MKEIMDPFDMDMEEISSELRETLWCLEGTAHLLHLAHQEGENLDQMWLAAIMADMKKKIERSHEMFCSYNDQATVPPVKKALQACP
ncbi:MAG: hypothetical protein HQK59_14310 [Deltaproteobacteria bacterium]|nr:hypothetical protein [Deltaproteobacteria bacterium]